MPKNKPFEHTPRFVSAERAQPFSYRNEALVGIVCRVVKILKDKSHEGSQTIWFADQAGHEMFCSTAISSGDSSKLHLIEEAREALCHGKLMVAFGTYNNDNGALDLVDLRPMTRPTTLLAPESGERERINQELDRLIETKRIEAHLLSEIHQILGVQTEYLSARHRLAEKAVLVQALAIGQVPRGINSRISMFLFSPPGTGKNLLGEYARLLAPVSARVQPAMVSPAGLSAHVEMTAEGYKANPGILPKTSNGVLVMDDLHRVEKRMMNVLQSILMTVLEEGMVRPMRAAQANYDARCSLLMTSNRMSIRDHKMVIASVLGPLGKSADIVVPFDLLSRTDLLFHLGTGDDAVGTAMKMASQHPQGEFAEDEEEDLATPTEADPHFERSRSLKMLVALLKERIPVVSTQAIAGAIEEMTLGLGVLLREYTSKVKGVFQESFDGEGLIRRMALTLMKLIGGHARLAGRKEATLEDLQAAWDLLTPKLEIVYWLCNNQERIRPLPNGEEQLRRVLAESEARWAKVMEVFGGRMATIEQLMELLSVNEKMVRHELNKRKIHAQGAEHFIPLAEAWVDDPRSNLDLKSELTGPAPETPVRKEDEPPPPKEEAPKEPEWNDGLPKAPWEIRAILKYFDRNIRQELESRLLKSTVFDGMNSTMEHYFEDLAEEAQQARRKGQEVDVAEVPPYLVDRVADWLRASGDWEERTLRTLSFVWEFMDQTNAPGLKQILQMGESIGIPEPIKRWILTLHKRAQTLKDKQWAQWMVEIEAKTAALRAEGKIR